MKKIIPTLLFPILLSSALLACNHNNLSEVVLDAGRDAVVEYYEKRTEKIIFSLDEGISWEKINQKIHYVGAARPGYVFKCWSVDGIRPIEDNFIFDRYTRIQALYEECPNDVLMVVARSENVKITLNTGNNSNQVQGLYYSLNANQYYPLVEPITLTLPNIGDAIYLKGGISRNESASLFTNSQGKFALAGQLSALINGARIIPYQAGINGPFEALFAGANVYSARELNLNFDNVPINAYQALFKDCHHLVARPNLTAKTINSYSYAYMFKGCSSLLSTGKLSIKTIVDDNNGGQFKGMYEDCIALNQNFTQLNFTHVYNNMYEAMFSGCEALSEAPELYLKDTAISACAYMFSGCNALKEIKVHYDHSFKYARENGAMFNNWVSFYPYSSYVDIDVTITNAGTFYCSTSLAKSGDITFFDQSKIPTNWIIRNF